MMVTGLQSEHVQTLQQLQRMLSGNDNDRVGFV